MSHSLFCTLLLPIRIYITLMCIIAYFAQNMEHQPISIGTTFHWTSETMYITKTQKWVSSYNKSVDVGMSSTTILKRSSELSYVKTVKAWEKRCSWNKFHVLVASTSFVRNTFGAETQVGLHVVSVIGAHYELKLERCDKSWLSAPTWCYMKISSAVSELLHADTSQKRQKTINLQLDIVKCSKGVPWSKTLFHVALYSLLHLRLTQCINISKR